MTMNIVQAWYLMMNICTLWDGTTDTTVWVCWRKRFSYTYITHIHATVLFTFRSVCWFLFCMGETWELGKRKEEVVSWRVIPRRTC